MLQCEDHKLHVSLYVHGFTGLKLNVSGCHFSTRRWVQSGRLIHDLHQIPFIDGLIVIS